jgi:uncharacterized membrane protein (DUF441 family)
MQKIKELIAELLLSKKLLAMVAGVVVTLLAKVHFQADATTITQILSVIVSYILGQGLADFGKSAAKEAIKSQTDPE